MVGGFLLNVLTQGMHAPDVGGGPVAVRPPRRGPNSAPDWAATATFIVIGAAWSLWALPVTPVATSPHEGMQTMIDTVVRC